MVASLEREKPMVIHVRDKTTDALVRELALKRGVGLTDAVRLAVEAELKRNTDDASARLAKMRAVADEIANRPRTGLKADKAFFDELSGD